MSKLRNQNNRGKSNSSEFKVHFIKERIAQVQIERQKIIVRYFHKYVKEISPGYFMSFFFPQAVKNLPDSSKLKNPLFSCWISEGWNQSRTIFQSLCDRYMNLFAILENQYIQKGWKIQYGKFSLSSKMVVGLGSASFWETGMIFHKPSGLPYIPASSLKGLTRAVAFEHAAWERIDEITRNKILNENNYEKRLEIIQNKVFKPAKDTIENWFSRSNLSNNTFLENLRNLWENLRGTEKTLFTIGMLFGTQGYAGRLVFVDAFPAEPPTFDLDIMNVHYPDYYSNPNKKYALDVENPNPITFLVVKDTPFHFLIALRPAPGITTPDEDKKLIDKAWNWLKKGLSEYGVGAKTRLGYGIFHTQEDMKP